MIRLTLKSNKKPIYIAPEAITAICDNRDGGAEVYSGVDFSLVTESPEEVARKVLEWRLAMERYRAYVTAAALDENPQSNESWELAANAKAELVRLAGLEEPNHDP